MESAHRVERRPERIGALALAGFIAVTMPAAPLVAQPCAWQQAMPLGLQPPGRAQHAIAYDSVRDRVVLFGGVGANYVTLGDTWEWDGQSWERLITGGRGPRPMTRHAMAFDPVRGKTVLYTGYTGYGGGDTWEWDGATWTHAASLGPCEGHSYAMAFHPRRGRALLFGGYTYCADATNDMWEWTGSQWLLIHDDSIEVHRPAPRFGHLMAYDAARDRLVVYGGQYWSMFTETWEWDGVTWRLATAVAPLRYAAMMTYDAARRRVVLTSGHNGSGSVYYNDTWAWDGDHWSLVATAGPTARSGGAMTYDSARDRCVVIGGYSPGLYQADVWTWDGRSSGPVIETQPTDQHAYLGKPAKLTIHVAGTPPLEYQWRRHGIPIADGGNISGAATSTLRFDPLTSNDATRYDVAVSDACGSTVSTMATIRATNPPCPGDVNGDLVVNFTDVSYLLAMLGQTGPSVLGDVNGDGIVNFADLNIVLSNFGATC